MPTTPITHYKDIEADKATADIVSQELDKEASSRMGAEKPAEQLKVLPVKKTEKKTNASNIVNAFRQKMSVNSTPIDLPSIGKCVEFREISTAQQKELSRVAMENGSRSDIIYCTMLGMINKLAVGENGFDIRDYTEFERISIILSLQQMNKINPEIKYVCSSCGKENSYVLDTQKILRNFSKTYKVDKTIEIEYGSRKFTFVVGWPNVGNIEDFFKNYYKKYDNSSKKVKESIDNLSQVEYITMFIKSIKVEEASDQEDSIQVNLEELTYPDRVQIIDSIP